MYVRIKRQNQSVFMHVEPSDSFGTVKERLGSLYNMEAANIQLIADDKKRELVDLATVSDQDIKTDDIVYMVFMKPSGGFEEISVEELTPEAEPTGESKA